MKKNYQKPNQVKFKELKSEAHLGDSEKKQIIKRIQTQEKQKSGDVKANNQDGHIIDIKGLNKYYTNGYIFTHALKDVDLFVKRAEVIVLLGQSGSGKTTLLNMISGLDLVTEGKVIVADKAVHNMKEHQLIKFRRIHTGFIFQQYNLMPNLTALENVDIGRYLQKDPEKKLDSAELLKEVDLGEHLNKYPKELSGGQQQRVSICRAVAKNPDILFADEPTGALDEESGKKVLQVLMDINKNRQTTLIMVTHNSDVARLADRVFHIKDGIVDKVVVNKIRAKVDDIRW